MHTCPCTDINSYAHALIHVQTYIYLYTHNYKNNNTTEYEIEIHKQQIMLTKEVRGMYLTMQLTKIKRSLCCVQPI